MRRTVGWSAAHAILLAALAAVWLADGDVGAFVQEQEPAEATVALRVEGMT